MNKLPKLGKKGVIGLAQTPAVVIVLLTIGIVITVGMLIIAEVEDQVESTTGCNDTANQGSVGSCFGEIAFNATQSTQEGLDVLASFQSIFGIVVAAAVVLGLIVLFR